MIGRRSVASGASSRARWGALGGRVEGLREAKPWPAPGADEARWPGSHAAVLASYEEEGGGGAWMAGDPLGAPGAGGGRVVGCRGNPRARIAVVGEAPGADEDREGKPFVGRAGKLLDAVFEKGGGFDMETHVCVTNLVKRRPPGNRDPTPEELAFYTPRLRHELRLLAPDLICVAGRFAMAAVLGVPPSGITKLRGTWWGVDLGGGVHALAMPLFHPSYLLRNPQWDEGSPKDLTLGDIVEFRRVAELLAPPGVG